MNRLPGLGCQAAGRQALVLEVGLIVKRRADARAASSCACRRHRLLFSAEIQMDVQLGINGCLCLSERRYMQPMSVVLRQHASHTNEGTLRDSAHDQQFPLNACQTFVVFPEPRRSYRHRTNSQAEPNYAGSRDHLVLCAPLLSESSALPFYCLSANSDSRSC